jgi:hypothetical protein
MRSPYALLRDLHLGAGLFAAVFVAAYALSAAQMAYRVVRPAEPEVSSRVVAIPPGVGLEARPLARWLMREHDLSGDLVEVGERRARTTLRIAGPGAVHRVEVDRGARRAEIVSERMGAVRMLLRLHETGGLGRDHWALDAWGGLLLAVSLALLALAGSGLTMWFLRHRRLRFGVPLFVGTLVAGLTLLTLVRLA